LSQIIDKDLPYTTDRDNNFILHFCYQNTQ